MSLQAFSQYLNNFGIVNFLMSSKIFENPILRINNGAAGKIMYQFGTKAHRKKESAQRGTIVDYVHLGFDKFLCASLPDNKASYIFHRG